MSSIINILDLNCNDFHMKPPTFILYLTSYPSGTCQPDVVIPAASNQTTTPLSDLTHSIFLTNIHPTIATSINEYVVFTHQG